MAARNRIKEFWKNIPFKGLLYFSVVINVASAALIIGLIKLLPPIIPVLYGLPTGESQLLPTLGLFIVPTVALAITIANFFVGYMVKDKFSLKILIAVSTLASILSTITVVKIVLLVGFF